jgi:hypothetical protein
VRYAEIRVTEVKVEYYCKRETRLRDDDSYTVAPGWKYWAQSTLAYPKHRGVKWVIVLHSRVDATWHVHLGLLITAVPQTFTHKLKADELHTHITYLVSTAPCTGTSGLA